MWGHRQLALGHKLRACKHTRPGLWPNSIALSRATCLRLACPVSVKPVGRSRCHPHMCPLSLKTNPLESPLCDTLPANQAPPTTATLSFAWRQRNLDGSVFTCLWCATLIHWLFYWKSRQSARIMWAHRENLSSCSVCGNQLLLVEANWIRTAAHLTTSNHRFGAGRLELWAFDSDGSGDGIGR